MPFTTIPLEILPFQLVGDLFSEMVLADFRLTDWAFWVLVHCTHVQVELPHLTSPHSPPREQFVLVFDVFLLVMRDADLWYDFAAWVREHSGRMGSIILLFGTCTQPAIFLSFVLVTVVTRYIRRTIDCRR
jgi:hypothetical protein